MPKKKRKAGKRNKFVSGIRNGFGFAAKLFLRVVPVAVLVALLFLVFFKVRGVLYADPALDIREIRVSPANVLPPAVKTELERRWIGKNIFTADVRAVSRFLEQEPVVLKAETVKSFPAALAVRIAQRIPFALIRFASSGPSAVISEDGMVLGGEEDAESFTGPAFDAFETGWKKPVKGTRMTAKGFPQAVAFYQQFKHHPLAARETLTLLSLDYLGNLTVTLGEGPEVKLGRRPVEMLAQLQKLDPFLDPGERPKIQYVDLQFDDVIVKRRNK